MKIDLPGGDYWWTPTLTGREILISLLFLGIWVFFGGMIHRSIVNHTNNNNKMYRQAVSIDNNAPVFGHALDTNAGRMYAYGTMEAVNPISIDDLKSKHMRIVRRRQHYTMHTYTTHHKVGKSTVTRVHHYWSWDTVKTDRFQVADIKFLDRTFNFNDFDVHGPTTEKTVGRGHHKRDVYELWSTNYTGTIFAKTNGKNSLEPCILWSGKTIEECRKIDISSGNGWLFLFWLGWLLLGGACIYGFYYIDNDWLED